jgi:signal peptidase I
MSQGAKTALNVAAIVLIAAIALKYWFVEVIVIEHNGMAPTLVYGDEVLVWKGPGLDLADVLVCEHPVREGEPVIGRAIAFAGSRVWTDHNGQLYVNQDQTSTQNAREVDFYDVPRKKHRRMLLRQINYFGKHDHDFFVETGTRFVLETAEVNRGIYLLGDNRSEVDYDSRRFGEVDPASCWGQVGMLLSPSREARELGHGRLELVE